MAYLPGKMTLRKQFVWNNSLWTPAQLGSSLALWLDAADPASITLNGSTVSQWNDKSGNALHAVQGTASSQPVFTANGLANKSVITFDGINDFMDVVTTVFQGIGNFSVHWVFARLGDGSGSDPGGYRPAISLLSTTGADRGALHYVKNTNQLPASYPFYDSLVASWGNYDVVFPGTRYFNNQANILSFGAAASNWAVFRNGSQEGTAARGGAIGSDVNGIRLAQQFNPIRTSNIYIAEIALVLNADTSNRQLFEGYLAWKWGLVANLPTDHPFKNTPPV